MKSSKAANRARNTGLHAQFIFERSFRPGVVQATWLAHEDDVRSGGKQEARRQFSRDFPKGIGRMMKKNGRDVKK